VLAAQHDPYRFDTQAGHRDGKWFPDNFTALVPHGRIHLRKSMARRSTRAGLQGVPTKSVPARAYVTSREFKDGIRDVLAGRPPPNIHSGWLYEDGRTFACALRQRGLNPNALSVDQRIDWMLRLIADGTILSGKGYA
jgi:hypothetical protein